MSFPLDIQMSVRHQLGRCCVSCQCLEAEYWRKYVNKNTVNDIFFVSEQFSSAIIHSREVLHVSLESQIHILVHVLADF